MVGDIIEPTRAWRLEFPFYDRWMLGTQEVQIFITDNYHKYGWSPIMLPGGRCRNCGDRIAEETLVTCENCGRHYHAPCHAYHDEFECPAAEDGWVGAVEF